LFSFDVFGNGLSFWQTVLAFLMHNIPTIALAIVLVVSWKYEIVGGVVFILAGLLYAILVSRSMLETDFQYYYIAWIIQISGIAFAIGILFLIGWFQKRKK
jgi:hypothetical protein